MNPSSPSLRSIRLVQELPPSGKPLLFMAAPLLDAMDAEDLALARRRFHICGHCGSPLRIRVRSVASSGDTGGRRAHFAHAFGTGSNCPATTESCATVTAVQAKRFEGKQEGKRHHDLKTSLAEAIVANPSFQSAGCELSVRGPDNQLRRPDVLAITVLGPIAFDVQLSPPLIDTIKGRDTFYDPAWMPHTWIIDGQNTELLNLQGFQDLLAPQGGKILAWDEECAAQTHENQTLTMKIVSTIDRGDRITSTVVLVSGKALNSLLGLHANAPAMSADFHALACFEAVERRDPRKLADLFNARVGQDAAITEADLAASGIMPLLGALATIFRGTVSDGSAHPPEAIGAVVNGALNLDCRDRRHCWAHVLKAAMALPEAECSLGRLGPKTPSILQRALDASTAEQRATLYQVWTPVLRRLFPGVAAQLQLT